jgi:hypothetical protein
MVELSQAKNQQLRWLGSSRFIQKTTQLFLIPTDTKYDTDRHGGLL